jgi:hypothetical protein
LPRCAASAAAESRALSKPLSLTVPFIRAIGLRYLDTWNSGSKKND